MPFARADRSWSCISAISGETTPQHRGGQLISQRLAGACGHDGQRRLPGQHTLDHERLDAAKLLEPERPAQRVPRFLDGFRQVSHAVGCGRSRQGREPPVPRFCRFLGIGARLGWTRQAGCLLTDDKEETRMKKFALIAAVSGAFALAACGSSDDASEDAMADSVEMPADEAMAGVPDPVADDVSEAVEDATANAEAAAQTAEQAADAALDAVADVEAAAQDSAQ
jgi:hypothetical protein